MLSKGAFFLKNLLAKMYGSPKFAHLIQHTTTNILPQRDYLKDWYSWTSLVFAKIAGHGLKLYT